MKLCFNGQILKKTLPEKVSKLFEKTKVLEFNSDEQYFIFDTDIDKKIFKIAMKFYEVPKPFSDEDLDLFLKNKKELYKLAKQLNLPSLQNFTGSQLKPESYHHVSTSIEDEIIIFGEQNYYHHLNFKKSQLPTFPTFKYASAMKGGLHKEDNFTLLCKKFHSLQKQIDELEENIQNGDKRNNTEYLTTSDSQVEESSEQAASQIKKKKKLLRTKKYAKSTIRLKKKYAPKVKYEQENKLPKLQNPFNDEICDNDKASSSDEIEKIEIPSESSKDQNDKFIEMNKYILKTYNNLQFRKSRIPGSSHAHSSSLNEKCGNIDLLANTDGWFYQSSDKEHQYVMFKFDSPVTLDYYFMMTYALPKGFAHLKKWRLATVKENEDNKTVIINIDDKETLELDGPNKMCGFQIDYNEPVDNIIIQITGENVLQNYRLTLQNVYFATNPPLEYNSPFFLDK